jgi:hypothetical protein
MVVMTGRANERVSLQILEFNGQLDACCGADSATAQIAHRQFPTIDAAIAPLSSDQHQIRLRKELRTSLLDLLLRCRFARRVTIVEGGGVADGDCMSVFLDSSLVVSALRFAVGGAFLGALPPVDRAVTC